MATLEPVADVLDITIEQGATFRLSVTVEDDQTIPVAIDLTGTTIEAQVRRRFDSASVLATFTIENRDDVNGKFDIVLPYATTETIDENGVWDLEILYTNGDKVRYIKGAATISLEATK